MKIVFITHHTEAKEVNEPQFFTQGESGGTDVSSAYQLALDIIGRSIRRRIGTSIRSISRMATTITRTTTKR